MAVRPGTGKVGSTRFEGKIKVARARYSFASEGGAVGDIALRGDKVPSGAIVVDGYVDVTTAVTSGGAATVAVKLQAAADLNAADAIAAIGATGARKLDKFGDDTARVKTTAERTVTLTVGTAALTAGVLDVYLVYILPA